MPTDRCRVCARQIEIQIFKDTGWCSENHRKILIKAEEEGWVPDPYDYAEWACPDCGAELDAPWVRHTCETKGNE